MKRCPGCGLYYEEIEKSCIECGLALEKTDFRPPRQFLDEEPGRRTPLGKLLLLLVGLPCLFALGYAIYSIILALAE